MSSHDRNFRNGYGINIPVSPVSNTFQPNSPLVQSRPQTPVVYSQPHIMRNQLPESEPLSEYSEMHMTPTRTIPAPFRQTTPQRGVFQGPRVSPYGQPRSTRGQRVSPYGQPGPTRTLLPPTPQPCITHYNPDQSFVLQSTAIPSSPRYAEEFKKTGMTSSPVVKLNTSSTRNTSQGSKLNKVKRNRFFVGSIDQVVRWHKMAKESQLNVIYELSAILENISLNPKGVYTIILRSEQKNSTLPLQALFYPIDRELPRLETGGMVTCVGRMVGANKMQVYDIWPTTESLAGVKRVSFLCQRSLQEAHMATPEP